MALDVAVTFVAVTLVALDDCMALGVVVVPSQLRGSTSFLMLRSLPA